MRHSLLLVSLALLAACEPAPRSLDDIEIAEDFHFDTTRASRLDVAVGRDLQMPGSRLHLEMRRPDGALVFSGYLSERSDWRVLIDAALPRYLQEVELTLTGEGFAETRTVPLQDGQARVVFGT